MIDRGTVIIYFEEAVLFSGGAGDRDNGDSEPESSPQKALRQKHYAVLSHLVEIERRRMRLAPPLGILLHGEAPAESRFPF